MLVWAVYRVLTDTEIKPVKPGFLPAHKPGFTGLKTGGLPGFSGTRVAFPSERRGAVSGSRKNQEERRGAGGHGAGTER